MHNLIISVEQEQQRLVAAKDDGLNVAAGQVVQVVDPDEHEEMLKNTQFVNDTYSITHLKKA